MPCPRLKRTLADFPSSQWFKIALNDLPRTGSKPPFARLPDDLR